MAMVWIALLGGGDYAPEGLTGFGESIHVNEIANVYRVRDSGQDSRWMETLHEQARGYRGGGREKTVNLRLNVSAPSAGIWRSMTDTTYLTCAPSLILHLPLPHLRVTSLGNRDFIPSPICCPTGVNRRSLITPLNPYMSQSKSHLLASCVFTCVNVAPSIMSTDNQVRPSRMPSPMQEWRISYIATKLVDR
jgi:hypothetical protein